MTEKLQGVWRRVTATWVKLGAPDIIAVRLECGHRTVMRRDMKNQRAFEARIDGMYFNCLKCRPPKQRPDV